MEKDLCDISTDEWIKTAPFAPLPEHVLGLGYLKEGELQAAATYLAQAADLRSDDARVARDLQRARGAEAGGG